MKSPTLPVSNSFHRIGGWILSPESLWPGRWLLLVAAAVLVAAVHLLFGGFPAYAQTSDGAIAGLTLTSDEPQTLTITWDAASPTPKDYEVNWAMLHTGGGDSWTGSAITTDTSYTATELEQSEVYKVRVRARYENTNGPWSDEEELKVLWEQGPPIVIDWIFLSRIHKRMTSHGWVATNYVPRDNDPSTLDLAVRADVVDTAGTNWNRCEQDGMGMFQNRYIIDDLLQSFDFRYGSRVGDCIPGDYYIIYVVKLGTEFLRVGTLSFNVMGGPVALVGAQSLDGMPTITGTPSTGETLTADISGLTIDGSGVGTEVLNYQWISSDGDTETDIAGATGATYALTDTDVGKLVKVKVFRDVAPYEGQPRVEFPAIAYSFPVIIDGEAISDADNQKANGVPTISGTAQVGRTLTASTSGIIDSDGLTNATFAYQWLSSDGTSDSDISGATSSTYTLVEGDAGNTIKVKVSFTDDNGHDESLTSEATAAVAAMPNTPAAGAPTISGTAQVEETLTADITGIADADGLTNTTFTYQWLTSRDAEIDGATGSTYTLVEADEGKTIKVRVSFTDDRGHQETLTSAATATVAASPSPLTASIHSAPESHDGQSVLKFELRFSEEFLISYVKLRNHAFTVTGGSVVGARRLERGENIRWEIGVRPDSNADVTVVLPVTTDCATQGAICTGDGRKLSNRLEFTVDGPVVSSPNNAATGAPTISGTAQVGRTLTASTSGITDSDGLTDATFAYQWLSSDVSSDPDISGATSSTYTLLESDEGKTIKVRVSFTDDRGHQETLTSLPTAAVAARPNSAATGAPTISGTVRVGQTLTASTLGISDSDGLSGATFTYQWLTSRDAEIDGATSSTYTLVEADEGKTIKVRVSFIDDRGHQETLTSEATAAVATSPNTPATGAPTISGTAQVEETLTADITGIADANGLTNATFTYQWMTGGSDIDGATGSSHTLTTSEQGNNIQVRVSFTDDADNDETLTSAATASVAAARSALTVSLTGAPTTHDGSAIFTFEMRFSEEPSLSYRTLKLHAFTVTGGSILKAQRTNRPSNIPWRITVQPGSNGDVGIVLSATTDCGATGAICTEDGRMLSSRLELTVQGPGQ